MKVEEKTLDEEMENLFYWIIYLQGCNLCMLREMIRQQTKALSTTESLRLVGVGSMGL